MSKFTFKFEEQTVSVGNKQTTVEFNALSLNTILNEFTDFLKGCGYHIDGYVDIVKPTGVVSDNKIDPLNPDTWPSPKNTPAVTTVDLSGYVADNWHQAPSVKFSTLNSSDVVGLSSYQLPAITSDQLSGFIKTTDHHPV